MKFFVHDCPHCIYLGMYQHLVPCTDGTVEFEILDLYWCIQPVLGFTIVARYGDYGGDYHSGIFPGTDWYDEAIRRYQS